MDRLFHGLIWQCQQKFYHWLVFLTVFNLMWVFYSPGSSSLFIDYSIQMKMSFVSQLCVFFTMPSNVAQLEPVPCPIQQVQCCNFIRKKWRFECRIHWIEWYEIPSFPILLIYWGCVEWPILTFRCDIPVVFYRLNTKYITSSLNTTKFIALCCTICCTTTCFGPFLGHLQVVSA